MVIMDGKAARELICRMSYEDSQLRKTGCETEELRTQCLLRKRQPIFIICNGMTRYTVRLIYFGLRTPAYATHIMKDESFLLRMPCIRHVTTVALGRDGVPTLINQDHRELYYIMMHDGLRMIAKIVL